MKTLYEASWIAPMDGPPLRDGALVTHHGRILAVGPAAEVRKQHPDVQFIPLGQSILLPAMVNAHVHLELTSLDARDLRAATFTGWILNLISRRQAQGSPTALPAAIAAGIRQCLDFGVSCVGDISRSCDQTRPLLMQSPLRTISFGEVIALGAGRDQLDVAVARAADDSFAKGRVHVGISPHAPYTVEPAGFRRCLEIARELNLPIATHLAETPDEAAFLTDHSGPFRDFLELMKVYSGDVPRFAGGPIRFAKSLGLLDHPTLLAHVNYVDDDELSLLAGGRASVVYCPRTHAYFNHPPHRWREMLDLSINVAIGTDSCASSPDLNLLDDLRLMHRIAPEVPASLLWRMATLHGARALGVESDRGSLSRGKFADMAAFPAQGADPLLSILEEPLKPTSLWINGSRT